MDSIVKKNDSRSKTAYNKKLISEVLYKAKAFEDADVIETDESKMYDAMVSRRYDIEIEHNRAEVANLYVL